jgi:hypothetical protein
MSHDTSAVLGDLRTLFVRDVDTLIREIELLPDDESLWRTLPGVANSCGNLALHCAGNLQHFVGGVLGRSGYVRDRAHEFGARSGTRAEVVAELQRAREAVEAALLSLRPETLAGSYPEPVGAASLTLPAQRFLIHLAVHLGFHLGQADYLRRILSADGRTADTVSLKPLAG